MDSSLHLVPGRYKPPTAPGGSLRKDSSGWEKAENKFTRPQAYLRVCVCPVSPPYMHVCVPVCRVCHYKPDNNYYYYYLRVKFMISVREAPQENTISSNLSSSVLSA